MKKWIAVLFILMAAVSAACAEDAAGAPGILVAFFSRAGENYNVGIPKEGSPSASYAGYIEKGNTALLAEAVAEAAGGDLFAVTTVNPYPEDYAAMLQAAQEEIDRDARPELAGTVENMEDYDVVFIGYPIWHGKMPQAVLSFLESCDLSGKTVIPFNTHEGSGQSGTQQVIEALLPGSTVLQGLAVRGKTAQEDPEQTRNLVNEWLEELGMLKTDVEESAVMSVYEAIQQAMIDKDIETLERLYLEGTTFTHMSGKTQTREEFFGEIADGTLNYFAYDIRHPQLTVNGTEASLSASVALTAKVYGASGTWTLPLQQPASACSSSKWLSPSLLRPMIQLMPPFMAPYRTSITASIRVGNPGSLTGLLSQTLNRK